MTETGDRSDYEGRVEVHDREVLRAARSVIERCSNPAAMQAEVVAAVRRNELWRGEQCLNLLAPEAPTSSTVRALLGSEIGTRAAEGHIGPVNRWFAGTRHIDEVESLCMELLKRLFDCDYAEHRLCASMIGNLAVYTALARPGETIMSLAQPVGGHSSNRSDGPAGVRGLRIVDIPVDPEDLSVDLESFAEVARRERPVLVALGASMTLFPYPVSEMATVVGEWGGRVFFDGAHQLGLIAGGQFQDPLKEGAAVVTGSGGKTFCGPQSGVMVWNDDRLTGPLAEAVFPTLAATHQVNRVAALAAAACELLAFGRPLMAEIVANARALAAALEACGVPVLGGHRGYRHAPGDRRRLYPGRRAGVRSTSGPGQRDHQQEPASLGSPRELGTSLGAAYWNHRGNPLRDGSCRDDGDCRCHRCGPGGAAGPGGAGGSGAGAACRVSAPAVLFRLTAN